MQNLIKSTIVLVKAKNSTYVRTLPHRFVVGDNIRCPVSGVVYSVYRVDYDLLHDSFTVYAE